MATPHATPEGVIRFSVFDLDLRSGELRKHGIKVKLQEQPFQILSLLLLRPGELVTREELRARIWPTGTFLDFDQGLYSAIKKLREALGDSADTPRFIETLSRKGYRFIGEVAQSVRPQLSVAVLPLVNLSHDHEQEYFADGLTEALITALAKIGDLRVLSRTSSMQYKGVRRPLREIAQELGVAYVVEGSVLRSGDRVRITAQLIEAVREAHLWAETYDRNISDMLAVHSELAQAIAREVRVKLTPQEQAEFAKVRTLNAAAYDLYLKGRYYWARRPAEFGKAMRCFEESVKGDPTYAPAYSGLADCLSGLNAWGLVPWSDGCVKAKPLAERAIELDHGSGEAYASLAYATLYHFDFMEAERHFERAIELSPRYATAHQFFGFFLAVMGRYEEAYTELKRAIRLDPLSSIVNAFLGYVFIYGRRYDEAIVQFLRTLELDPYSGPAHGGLGWAYRCRSEYGPAIASFEKAVELWPGSTPRAWLAETYAAAGNTNKASEVVASLLEMSKERYVSAYGIARAYATLEEPENAFRWLEKAYEQHAEWMVLIKVDPAFDRLRTEQRFQSLLRRMRFPD